MSDMTADTLFVVLFRSHHVVISDARASLLPAKRGERGLLYCLLCTCVVLLAPLLGGGACEASLYLNDEAATRPKSLLS